MAELQEFFTDLMQDVAVAASARGELTRTIMVEDLVHRLIDAEELQDWEPSFFEGRGFRRRILGLDGYSTDELDLDGTLHVLVAELREGDEPASLVSADINAAFSRATGFVIDASEGRLDEVLEPSTPAADLARLVRERRGKVKTIRVLLLSNALLGARYREVDRDSIDGVKVELNVWDLARFHQLAAAGGREEVDIDLTEFAPRGLPALSAGIGETGYAALLCVVPGNLLADIYDRYGSRLLEGNVRAFLSTRGAVNKGIRKTLNNCPQHFFAFNNGITATATEVELVEDAGQQRLLRVRDLQIVNGGQTTASMYNSRQRDKTTLDGVFVQMKLSVLPVELAQDLIPQISQYANTQNRVSDADLFANHPFHRKVEDLSRRVWAPPAAGSHLMTHWFYERARAQYQTGHLMLTGREKREFLAKNPKKQVFTKTDLAKFENSWRMLPHLVSGGAQKNFKQFADTIRGEFDKRPHEFNERWFQHLVAKAIIFRSTESLVSAADWYTGGYRANIVTYAIARVVKLIGERFPGHVIDLDRIWKAQAISEVVTQQLERAAHAACEVLVAPPEHWKNVTEWAKKEQCWQRIQAVPVTAVSNLRGELRAADEETAARRDARSQDKDDSSINAQVEVIRLAQEGYWERALASPRARQVLSPTEFGILTSAVSRPNWVPSDAQARRLMTAARKLDDEGIS